MTDPLKTLQQMAEALTHAQPRAFRTVDWDMHNAAIDAGKALIAQMQRDAVQPESRCMYPACNCFSPQGPQSCAHPAPHPEAQALDSQLQQPDGHSTPCVEAASTTPLPCPFCGGEPSISGRAGSSSEDAAFVAFAACYGDGYAAHAHHHASGETLEEAKAAVLAIWNRRSAAGAQQQDDHAGSPAPSDCSRTEHYFVNGECLYCLAPAPSAWMWQHEETGNVGFVDPWQVENGWQEANPRLKLIRPLYTHPAPSAESSKAALSDEEIFDTAVGLDMPYEFLPDSYCEGLGIPPGTRAYGDVTKEQLLAFARAILSRAGIGESRHE